MKPISYYVSMDGDLVGRKLEHLIITGQLEELIEFGKAVNSTVSRIENIATEVGGKTYLHGGDSLLVEVPNYTKFLNIVRTEKSKYPVSFSVGVGVNPISAYLALKYAKSTGRDLAILAEENHSSYTFTQIDW